MPSRIGSPEVAAPPTDASSEPAGRGGAAGAVESPPGVLAGRPANWSGVGLIGVTWVVRRGGALATFGGVLVVVGTGPVAWRSGVGTTGAVARLMPQPSPMAPITLAAQATVRSRAARRSRRSWKVAETCVKGRGRMRRGDAATSSDVVRSRSAAIASRSRRHASHSARWCSISTHCDRLSAWSR